MLNNIKMLNSNFKTARNFCHLKFEFVSDFEIRISNLFDYDPLNMGCTHTLPRTLNGNANDRLSGLHSPGANTVSASG
jgi:hypothetical protein